MDSQSRLNQNKPIKTQEQASRSKVTRGRQFEYTRGTVGFNEVLVPRLKLKLEEYDKKCHDINVREDLGKYYIGKYNALMEVFKEFDLIIKEMEQGARYCQTKNINIE